MELNVSYCSEPPSVICFDGKITDSTIGDKVQKVRVWTKDISPNISHHNLIMFQTTMEALNIPVRGDVYGPLWTYIMVVPGRYFHIKYAKDDHDNFIKLPIRWLSPQTSNGSPRGDESFIRNYHSDNIITLEKRYTPYNTLSHRTMSQFESDECCSVPSVDINDEPTCCLPLDTRDGCLTVLDDNPSS